MTFEVLQGQHNLRRALIRGLQEQTISHAVLLSGPAGSGKLSWGKALAQALLCTGLRDGHPCGSCLSCLQFNRGNHPRFFFLEPQSRRLKIEQIRDVRSKFYLSGENNVCLINQAETMTAEAASSLLKILEEPPVGLNFILLSEDPRRLFSTIISRCQRFILELLREEEIIDILVERVLVAREKAVLVSRLSGGLPGRAIALAGDPAFEQRLQEGSRLAETFLSGELSIRELLDLAVTLSEREDLLPLLEMVYLYIRDCLIDNLSANKNLLAYPGRVVKPQKRVAPLELEQMIGMLDSFLREINSTNVNRRLAVEGLLIEVQRRFA